MITSCVTHPAGELVASWKQQQGCWLLSALAKAQPASSDQGFVDAPLALPFQLAWEQSRAGQQARHTIWQQCARDELSPFADRVLTLLLSHVQIGFVVTYGQLAAMAGRPGAARAVGSVMRHNQWHVLIPCHRVVPADRTVGRYGGLEDSASARKQRLLEQEGICVAANGRIDEDCFLSDVLVVDD